jgi:hypothetical protein
MCGRGRDVLFPPRVASKAPEEIRISVDLLRNILDRALTLDPSKRLTAAEGVAMFSLPAKGAR